MATIIDALVITLGLDPKGVNTGMQQAKGALDTGVKSIVSDVVKPLSVLLAGAFAGGAIIQRFVDAAELGKLSQQLNTSVEDLQAWQGAAIQAGGSAEGLLAAAKGLRDRTGSRLPITQQLLYAADQLKGLSEVRAMEVGKSWGFDENTIKLLRQGRQAVQELVNQQKEMVAFSKEDVAMIQKMKLGYDGLRNMIFSVSNLVIKLFLPAINWMAEKMQSATGFFPEARRRMGLVSQWISENGPHIQNVFGAIAGVITARLIPSILRLALSMLPFLPFVLIIGALALAVDSFITYLNGGESAMAGFLSQFGTAKEISANLAEAWKALKSIGLNMWTSLKEGAVVFFGYFPGQIDNIKSIFSGMIKAIVALFKGDFEGVGAALRQVFDGVVKYIKTLFTGAIEFIKDKFSLEGIGSALGGVWDAVKAVGKGFRENSSDTLPPPSMTVPPSAAQSGGPNVQAETTINGGVQVYSQATDAQGIARDISGATINAMNQNTQLAMAANTGQHVK